MGLLSRAKSGRTFDGKESNRKGFIDRVKWEMQEDELVYKFPHDNLSTGTVLIVNESQRAFFYANGVLCDSFGAGDHKLETGNIPFLQKFLNIPTGGETAFTAEVWFVNTEVVKRNMPWGAGSLFIFDPYYDNDIKIGARGQYGIKISDAEIFIKKMVGSMHSVTAEKIYDQFRVDVIEGMKVHLSTYLEENKLSIVKVGSHYIKIAQFIKQELSSRFQEYGVEVLNFSIEEIRPDESDENFQSIRRDRAEATGDLGKLDRLGDKYALVQQMKTMRDAAKNEGVSGGAMGMGMGAGMGLGMGNMMGNMMGGQTQQPQQPPPAAAPPPAPGAPAPPGAPVAPPVADIYLTQNGQTLGPYTVQQMQEYVGQNIVNKDSLVWKNGMQSWVAANTLPELVALFQAPPSPPPPPPPAG